MADYTKDGYEIIVLPVTKNLPVPLQKFQGKIDFIATRGGDARVVKVATTPSLSNSPYVKDLAEAVNNLEGWAFDW
ncbi:MAG: hypothetical protein HC892_06205 [Saprospiraceae bacterium]|nr:hypothetical protein [Saprospiraceae bacterium]